MVGELKEINRVLLKINNTIGKKDETEKDIENNFKLRKEKPMVRISKLGGKVLYDDYIAPTKYINIEDEMSKYEFK